MAATMGTLQNWISHSCLSGHTARVSTYTAPRTTGRVVVVVVSVGFAHLELPLAPQVFSAGAGSLLTWAGSSVAIR